MIFLCWLGIHARAWARVTFPKIIEHIYPHPLPERGETTRREFGAIQIGTCTRCGHSLVRRWSLA